MGKIVISRVANGPIRAVLEMEQEKLDQFRPRERNALLARCMEKAVRIWRGIYMRVWFSKRVLYAPYNYKLDQRSPFMDSGDMAKSVYTGQVTARAPKGSVKCVVTRPIPHPIRQETSRAFQVVPEDQIQFIADRFAELVAGGINNSETVRTNKPDVIPRRRLSVKQRRAFGLKARKR